MSQSSNLAIKSRLEYKKMFSQIRIISELQNICAKKQAARIEVAEYYPYGTEVTVRLGINPLSPVAFRAVCDIEIESLAARGGSVFENYAVEPNDINNQIENGSLDEYEMAVLASAIHGRQEGVVICRPGEKPFLTDDNLSRGSFRSLTAHYAQHR